MGENSYMSLVSIIVPIYNGEKYIDRCLESILNQTYKDIEIVIVDDGSRDNSLKILKNYQSKDKRIKIYHQENKGPSAARNTGLHQSIGEYVMFVDADDYIDKDMVRYMVESINSEFDAMVLCDNSEIWVDTIDERKLFEEYDTNISKDTVIKEIASGKAGLVCGKLFSRSIVEKNNIIFDKNISMCEDQIFFLNVSRYCEVFSHISKSLYFYDRRNENSITIKYQERAIENQIYVLQKIEDILNKCGLENNDVISIINNRFINAIQYCIANEVLDTNIFNTRSKLDNVKNIVSNNRLQQVINNINPKNLREIIVIKNFNNHRYVVLYGSFYILDRVIGPCRRYMKKLLKKTREMYK